MSFQHCGCELKFGLAFKKLGLWENLLTHSLWRTSKDGIKLHTDIRSWAQNVSHNDCHRQFDSLDFSSGYVLMRMSSGHQKSFAFSFPSMGFGLGFITWRFNSDSLCGMNGIHFLGISQFILKYIWILRWRKREEVGCWLISEIGVGTNKD